MMTIKLTKEQRERAEELYGEMTVDSEKLEEFAFELIFLRDFHKQVTGEANILCDRNHFNAALKK
jgi:hypothetical protein